VGATSLKSAYNPLKTSTQQLFSEAAEEPMVCSETVVTLQKLDSC
jgi:hypothetical protein